jgi:hypothetical protein
MVPDSRLVVPWQSPSSWLDADDEDDVAPLEPVPGDPARSAIAGACAGLLGAWLALGLVEGLENHTRLVEYLRVAIGSASSMDTSAASVWKVIALAGLAGMLPGAGLGWLMRRLHGLVARVVFGAVLVPSVWIAVDAFGIQRFAPRYAELVPFVPWLLGAVAYGVCVALVRPVVARSTSSRQRRLRESQDDVPSFRVNAPSATASFLLLRRKA